MTNVSESLTMLVALPESTVSRLMALRSTPDEGIADVVYRNLPSPTPAPPAPPPTKDAQQTSAVLRAKYTCDILGARLHASTLGSLFGVVVDTMDTVAPDALLRLSKKRTTKRRHLSRDKAGVHLGTRNLPVLRTRTGWWINKNVSQDQTVSHLRALCTSAGLEFGKDVRFPI